MKNEGVRDCDFQHFFLTQSKNAAILLLKEFKIKYLNSINIEADQIMLDLERAIVN